LEALTQALLLVKGQGPWLLVFDDLHWADPKTLVWLGYALRRFEPGILVLATSRDGEPTPDHHLSFLAGVRRGQRLTELELSPLSVTDVLRLLSEIEPLSGEATPFAQRLHEATRGNALFLVETLRELHRRGKPVPLIYVYVAGRRV
jgi:predicted ATPase